MRSEQFSDRTTFGHAQMNHFVECHTTNQRLHGLSFQQMFRKLIAKDGFLAENDGFRKERIWQHGHSKKARLK
ncbi:MAG: hypothetical protein A2W33_00985 [Chloroflexi bacterium RBG_16_52_11]|nr:MAG: hypothetical protein A2W33_00985 [Chloroflexi bacterium RBG_16_52_11]